MGQGGYCRNVSIHRLLTNRISCASMLEQPRIQRHPYHSRFSHTAHCLPSPSMQPVPPSPFPASGARSWWDDGRCECGRLCYVELCTYMHRPPLHQHDVVDGWWRSSTRIGFFSSREPSLLLRWTWCRCEDEERYLRINREINLSHSQFWML